MIDQKSDLSFNQITFNPFEDQKDIEKIVAINESQREIWLSCIIGGDEASLAYNESVSLDFTGPFQFSAFRKSLEIIVKRHEALRSSVSANGENFIIYKDFPFNFEMEDLSSNDTLEQQQLLREFVADQMNLTFDIQNGPLFRVHLHKLEDDHHYFTLVIHHLIGDGWSIGIILENLSKLYNAHLKGLPAILDEGPQISTYALEQHHFLQSEDFRKVENYWLDLYKGNIPVLDLPTDYVRPATRTYKAHRIDHPLSVSLISQLKAMGAKAGCSLVNTMLTAFEVFLYQQTRQRDIVVGLPTAGQSATENFELVGHCVNLLPLRSIIDPELSFLQYLKLRKSAFFDAYEHQQFSFGQLVKKLNVKRDTSRIPLVPVVFNMDMGMDSAVFFDTLQHHLVSNPRAYETFEIFLNLTGSKDSFILEWTYNTQLFKAATIERMTKEFEILLEKLAQQPELQLSDCAKTAKKGTSEAMKPVGHAFKNTIELINEVAGHYPDKTAVSFRKEQMSYKQLMEKSNQLAFYLIEKGVRAGDIIGLSTERSMEMLISLLAILKAGAVYIPLDPEYPHERIEFMLTDSAAKKLLTSRQNKGRFHTNAQEIVMEEIWQNLGNYPDHQPQIQTGPNDLAYILYTSGSTGKPKGVKITHKNLSNFLLSMQVAPGITADDRLLAITTISFDIAGLELYLPLISAAELVIADTEETKDGRLLLGIIEERAISIMQATPSTWQMMIDSDWQKAYAIKILSGGEALKKELADQLLKRCTALWNMYGPTETTIWSTIKKVSPGDQLLTIGHPINQTDLYIMDELGRPLPSGMPGEIYIGGAGVADGYLNRPELTNEKFIQDDDSGQILYKTGDLGKLLENGEYLCLGRIDQQVKIRGHRIELGEIETIIAAQEGIKQAVVLAREDAPSDKRLIAYVLLDDKTDQDNLSWKDRWDALYDMGAASKQDLALSEQNLDNSLLEHYENSADLALQAAEWLHSSTERIKLLGSKKIYEIGSGAGQLLFELAPETEYYMATDYAQTAIHNLNEKLAAAPDQWSHVKAKTAEADDFTDIVDTSFDLVLIHSVAQYFVNADYLIKVIKESVKSLRSGGCIFIGDMQGKNSLKMCHAMDHLPHAADSTTLSSFNEAVLNRVRIEDELVADPGFFYSLPGIIPEITGVDVQLRKGLSLNETTKYHYDIWLYVAVPSETAIPDTQVIWKNEDSLLEIERLLSANPSQVLELKNIVNKRTAKDHRLLQLMQSRDPNSLLKEIKIEVAGINEGSAPDLFWELGARLNFNAHVRWTSDGTDGLFDVVFIPSSRKATLPYFSAAESLKSNLHSYARLPFSKNEIVISKEIIGAWKDKLYKALPAYMVPDDFIALKSFPLTANAKIDRNAFPKPYAKRTDDGSNRQVGLVLTKNEQLVTDIWSAALGLEHLSLTDDFFELGGHSLLAVKVMIAIEKETGKRLPLATLFNNSTIQKLAAQLTADEAHEVWESLVPIKTTGKKDPLFMVHGGGLNVLVFKSISTYVSEEQPIYGLQALGLNQETQLYTSIEEIAAVYVAEIIKVNPNGPYCLCGYSLGGFIVYEMAKQLKDMGKAVKFLGILDTYAGDAGGSTETSVKLMKKIRRQFYKIPFFVGSFFRNPSEAIQYQIHRLRLRLDRILNNEVKDYTIHFSPYEKEIYNHYDKAHDHYKMEPSDIKISLFRVKKRLYYLDDLVYLGWNKFAKQGVETHDVPGDHETFLYSPNDAEFARILQDTLDKI